MFNLIYYIIYLLLAHIFQSLCSVIIEYWWNIYLSLKVSLLQIYPCSTVNGCLDKVTE